jgi:hypothetical protein
LENSELKEDILKIRSAYVKWGGGIWCVW